MPSDKYNSIMAIAAGLIFFTVQCCFVPRCAYLPTAAAPVLASWFYRNLPLFSFVLHSFLPHHIDDDLRYAHYGFGMRLGRCTASRGHLLHYSLLAQHVCKGRSKMKPSNTLWSGNTPTFKLINQACALLIEHSILYFPQWLGWL